MSTTGLKTTLRGNFRISCDNEIYQSKWDDFLMDMVLQAPKQFKPGDKVRVTIELVARAKRRAVRQVER